MNKNNDISNIIVEENQQINNYNKGVECYNEERLDDAEIFFKKALLENPDLAEAYINLGAIYFKKGDLIESINMNNKGLEILPKSPFVHSNIAFAYLQLGDSEKAITASNKALECDEKFIPAICNLAIAYIQKQDYDKSIQYSKKALEFDKGFAPAINNMAVALYYQGNFKEAIEYCDRAMSMGYQCDPEFLVQLQEHR